MRRLLGDRKASIQVALWATGAAGGCMTNLGIYRRLLSYIKPYRMKLVISLILTTIVAAAMPAIALLVKYVMDKVFIAKDQFWLILLAMYRDCYLPH